MHLQGRDLRPEQRGDDVKRLQEELAHIGLAVPGDEQQRAYYGPGTRGRVLEFQRSQGLPTTGVVDARTAAAVNRTVAAGPATTRGDELFRFVQLRGVVPAEADDNLLIRAWSDPPSQLENALVAAADAGGDPIAVAEAWLNDVALRDPLNGLLGLDAALAGSADEVTVGRLGDAVRRFMDVENVVNAARATAQDLLAAVILVPDATSATRDRAHRLVVLAVASQRALQWGDEADEEEHLRRDRALREILVRGAAVLSPRVSRLLGPGLALERRRRATGEPAQPAEAERERLPRTGTSPQEGRRHRDAALAELIALATDPEVSRVVVPAIGAPPDETAPRLRRIGEITLRRPRVRLEGAVLDRLSEDTRRLVERLAPGETDLLSVVNAVDKPILPAAPAAAPAVPNDPTAGFPPGYGALRPPWQGLVRPPGVGDLLSVRRDHESYILGPITYIENVLAGETRRRTHRRLDRTEETTFTETERTVVDERDLQQTERFDLVNETQNEVNNQIQLQVGAQVSGSYGTVQASASFGFTSSSATTEATRTATTTARETVDRALKRITERTLERRQRITIREVEEKNLHELSNPDSTNRAGIYRFVDDEQTVGVYSYGLRLMVEAHVPEPGAYLCWATAPPPGETEPPRPSVGVVMLSSPDQIEPTNYLALAGEYQAVVEPPPPALTTVGMSDRQEFQDNTPQPATPAYLFYRSYERLQVPDGYEAISAAGAIYASAWMSDVYITVGKSPTQGAGGATPAMPFQFSMSLANETGTIPIAMSINNAWGFALTIELTCQRSARMLDQWRIRTFNAIMQAYDDRHSTWQERQRAASIGTAGLVTGTNPDINRQVERTELKKGVISLLSGSPLWAFGGITQPVPTDEPTIDAAAAVGQSAIISFYEQAFEWENTVYSLYPYFWGRHDPWRQAFEANGTDPLRDAFMRAGLARVVVPVRPGFETVALWFLATGQVWYGGSPPPISYTDPLYRSIAAELLAIDEADRGGVLQGSTWTAVAATNLVYLQADAELNPEE